MSANLLNLPPGESPLIVRPSFLLLAIHKIDDEAETFEFSGILTLVWRDSRQAFDPLTEGVGEKFYHGNYQFNEVSPSWYPQVVLGNATGMDASQGVLLRVRPDGTSTLIQTIHSVARSRLNLRRYPFDQQRMEAMFAILGFDESEVAFAMDESAVATSLARVQVPQWEVRGIDTSVRHVPMAHLGAGSTASLFVISVELSRQPFFMVRLVILPLMLIVILSWSVFWMDRSSLGDRMSVSFVGILTAVSYQILVSAVMPQISYVTFMNAFLSFSFLIMGATVVVNLAVGTCDRQGNSKRGDRIDQRCRRFFPLVYAALILLSAWLAFAWF